MAARIYQRIKNNMQSGRARTDQWVLEYDPAGKFPDPLTGWTGSDSTQDQVRMSFPTLEAARAYADAQGIAYHIVPSPVRRPKIRTYAENFT